METKSGQITLVGPDRISRTLSNKPLMEDIFLEVLLN